MVMISIAMIQPDIVWESVEPNLRAFTRILRGIGEPVDVIFLPELFTTGFTMRSRELCEPMEGRTMEWMAAMSGELKSSIAGSIIIQEGDGYFNRLIWMQKDGKYRFYDKRHLFRMSGEDEHYTKGGQRVIVREGEFRFLPLICYDLRFPVWSRNRNDYDVLVYLANWPAPRKDVWSSLLKARAIENQAFVIGVNRVGKDGMGIEYSGDSLAFNAKGRRIASLGTERAGTRIVRLNLNDLNAFREKFPAWRDADLFTLCD
jgi:omega-amidase